MVPSPGAWLAVTQKLGVEAMDYVPTKKRPTSAKKLIRKYGKDFFRLIGQRGWEKRQDIMLQRVGRYYGKD